MKFLKTLFGGGAQKDEEKGDELRLDLDYREAAYFYAQALEKLEKDDTEGTTRVKTKLKEVRRNAFSQLMEEVSDLVDGDELDLARERLDIAANFADDPVSKAALETRMAELDGLLNNTEGRITESHTVTAGTEGDLYELALGGLEEQDRERAPQLGDAFRTGFEACQNEAWSEALGTFTEALKQNPDEPLILELMAMCHERLGEMNSALESYRRVQELAPFRPATVQGLSAVYRALERPGEALNILTSAATQHPVSADLSEHWIEIHVEHAMALSDAGHPDDAVSSLLSLLDARTADRGHIYYNLAGVLEKAGRDKEAMAALERCIEASPRRAVYKERLADFIVKHQGDLKHALHLLVEANEVETTAAAGMFGGGGAKVTISPNRARYLYKIAKVYFLDGQDKEAERTIATALAVSRDSSVTAALEDLREELKASKGAN